MRSEKLIIIGSSSGGPQTLKRVFSRLPVLDACILLVQHMPRFLNESLKNSLMRTTDMEITLAREGACIQGGSVIIAPSEVHLELVDNRIIHLVDREKVNFVRPAIDVTMKSITPDPGITIVGVILTGIGADGAKGLAHIKAVGGTTIAQDEATSVIYGMPKAAAATGKVDHIMTPEAIGDKIVELVRSRRSVCS